MTKRIQPRGGKDYTFKQIVEQLDLRDAACLMFNENNMEQNIQDSHISELDVLKLPHWADSLWTYKYETDEWIPVFKWSSANTVSIDELIDKEPHIDPYAERPGVLWCVPKGQTREQYHKVVVPEDGSDPYITGYGSDDRHPLPTFDDKGLSEHYYIRRNNAGRCDYCKGQVERRFNYRDPSEGCCKLYEVCAPCIDRARKANAAEFDE